MEGNETEHPNSLFFHRVIIKSGEGRASRGTVFKFTFFDELFAFSGRNASDITFSYSSHAELDASRLLFYLVAAASFPTGGEVLE
jgi:hypothetical protein